MANRRQSMLIAPQLLAKLIALDLAGRRARQIAEMPFAEHNNMVETIPSDRTDQPL